MSQWRGMSWVIIGWTAFMVVMGVFVVFRPHDGSTGGLDLSGLATLFLLGADIFIWGVVFSVLSMLWIATAPDKPPAPPLPPGWGQKPPKKP